MIYENDIKYIHLKGIQLGSFRFLFSLMDWTPIIERSVKWEKRLINKWIFNRGVNMRIIAIKVS